MSEGLFSSSGRGSKILILQGRGLPPKCLEVVAPKRNSQTYSQAEGVNWSLRSESFCLHLQQHGLKMGSSMSMAEQIDKKPLKVVIE